MVAQGLQDAHPKVRAQAAEALGELAEHCQPEINAHARQALPIIFQMCQDSEEQVQKQAFYALVTFCETLGEHPQGGAADYEQQAAPGTGCDAVLYACAEHKQETCSVRSAVALLVKLCNSFLLLCKKWHSQ